MTTSDPQMNPPRTARARSSPAGRALSDYVKLAAAAGGILPLVAVLYSDLQYAIDTSEHAVAGIEELRKEVKQLAVDIAVCQSQVHSGQTKCRDCLASIASQVAAATVRDAEPKRPAPSE